MNTKKIRISQSVASVITAFVGVVVLMELAGLKGRERLSGCRLESAICYEGK